jgi:hypothetical protein
MIYYRSLTDSIFIVVKKMLSSDAAITCVQVLALKCEIKPDSIEKSNND